MKRKPIFRKPRHFDVLIYDRVGSEFVRRCLGGIDSWGIMDVRGVIYLHPVVVLKSLKYLYLKWQGRNQYLNKAQLKIIMEVSVLSRIKPKVVVTFGENNERFGLLSRIYKEALFLGIQNGLRGPRASDIKFNLHLTNCLCFGQETIDKYHQSSQSIGWYEIIGSLKNGFYKTTRKSLELKRYDICFISQYRPARFENTLPLLKEITTITLEFILRYCNDKGMTFCVAGSCKENNFLAEYRFFRGIVGCRELIFLPNDDTGFSTYKAIDQSTVSITNHSTVGFEGLARGNKVVFFNPTDDEYYDIPKWDGDGLWVLQSSDKDYGRFKARMDAIFEIDSASWRHMTKEFIDYFVHSDPRFSPQERVNSIVRKHLNGENIWVDNGGADA